MLVRTFPKVRSRLAASPFSSRQKHSLPGLSTVVAPPSRRHVSRKVGKQQENSTSPFNLWAQIREARPAVRYTVYAGVGLMATAETTFWFNVIKAKYVPYTGEEERENAARFVKDLQAAVKGYRAVWMKNYSRYYGAYIWGVDYGGLDNLGEVATYL